jgi:hypothetical protein
VPASQQEHSNERSGYCACMRSTCAHYCYCYCLLCAVKQSALSGVGSMCSGDDWDCYNTAQRALISLINAGNNHYNSSTATTTSTTSSSSGSSSRQHPSCTVVITGDYHYGDIKRMHNGPGTPYADWLGTADIARPLMQVLCTPQSVHHA